MMFLFQGFRGLTMLTSNTVASKVNNALVEQIKE